MPKDSPFLWSGLFIAGAVLGSAVTYYVVRVNARPRPEEARANQADLSSTVRISATRPKSTQPVFSGEKLSAEKEPEPELMNSLQSAADQWAQAQKNSIHRAFSEAFQQQKEEKLTKWLPVLAQRLQLTNEQRFALEQALQEKGPGVLESDLSSLSLTPTQQEQFHLWQQERRQTRAESAAYRALSQLIENLPLTEAQKDQIWPLLSQEALNTETSSLSSEQLEDHRQRLCEKLIHILGAQNAEIIKRALPSLSPSAEMIAE